MTGNHLSFLTAFFNSKMFRFCFKDNFPELLGDSRELRKVFFENIRIKSIDNERWYENILEEIITNIYAGKAIDALQLKIEQKLFDLYDLSGREREMILQIPFS